MYYSVQKNKINIINYIILLCFFVDYFFYFWVMVLEFVLLQCICYNVYLIIKNFFGIKVNDFDMIVLVGELCFIVMYYSLYLGIVIIKIIIKEGVRC